MNALMLLKTDHRTVEELFSRFEKMGEKAKGKKALAQKIVKELAIHASIEEQIFYPAVRKAVKAAEDQILESLEEHHVVKWMLSEVDKMDPEDERYDAKMTVLMENVRHHVKEEEQDLFPKVRKAMDAKQLTMLGEAMEKAKRVAPTRPHPRAPDTPPGNILAGLPAAMLDRARDGARSMMSKRSNGASRSKSTTMRTQSASPRRSRAR